MLKSFPGYAFRNTVLSVAQAGLLFTLATMFSQQNFGSVILYAFGIAILLTAFIVVFQVKKGQFNKFAMIMGSLGVISLFITSVMLQGAFGPLTFESTILSVAILVAGFGILVNTWHLFGMFGDFGKK